ncbi:hypothetical protein, partial [Aeromonas veronii]|uniref:hypothetical protein n=1 Tax=Aeromonas veronii TaxID=654 RepID=UPI00406D398C
SSKQGAGIIVLNTIRRAIMRSHSLTGRMAFGGDLCHAATVLMSTFAMADVIRRELFGGSFRTALKTIIDATDSRSFGVHR